METNTRITKLTTSQVKCFKACRKRYELEYIENLKPLETPKALEIGTLYHIGLEQLLKGMPIGTVTHYILETHHENADFFGIDYEPLNAYIAIEMVEHWAENSGFMDWKVIDVEKVFEVTTGYAKRLCGKLDGLVIRPETGKPYIMEHKTTSMWGTDGSDYLHGLLWDEQSTNYLYAHQRMLEDGVITGEAADGVFYDIIEKPTIKPYKATPLDQRKYTKDGRLYANQHEADETPEDYRERVHYWYAEKPRVHTAFVYRTPAQVQEQIKDFNLTVKDIVAAEREGTFYRNPQACMILNCPYAPKCLENKPDTDCLFVKKQAKNEEL